MKLTRLPFLPIAIGIAWLFATSATHAAVLKLTPDLAGNIRYGQGTSGSGSFAGNIIVGDSGSGTSRYLTGLLHFNLDRPELQGAVIQSVSLVFTVNGDSDANNPTPVTFQLYLSERPFTNNANWNNYDSSQPWQTPGGTGPLDRGALLSDITLNTLEYATSGKTFTLSSTAAFVSEVTQQAGSDLYLWFGLSPDDSTDGARHVLNLISINNANVNLRPTLVIEYAAIPEPSTALLLLPPALFGFWALRRPSRHP